MDEINSQKITKDAIMHYIREYGKASAQCQAYRHREENCTECIKSFLFWDERKNELIYTLDKIIGNLLED